MSFNCAYKFSSCFGYTACVYLCVFQLTLGLFSNLANQSEHGTQNLIPQGHWHHTLFIVLLLLGCGKLLQPLFAPHHNAFYRLPLDKSFHNHCNLLPADFPTEFMISFKIQRIKKGDTLKIHILPQSRTFKLKCTFKIHTSSGSAVETSFNNVWLLGALTGPWSKGEFK